MPKKTPPRKTPPTKKKAGRAKPKAGKAATRKAAPTKKTARAKPKSPSRTRKAKPPARRVPVAKTAAVASARTEELLAGLAAGLGALANVTRRAARTAGVKAQHAGRAVADAAAPKVAQAGHAARVAGHAVAEAASPVLRGARAKAAVAGRAVVTRTAPVTGAVKARAGNAVSGLKYVSGTATLAALDAADRARAFGAGAALAAGKGREKTLERLHDTSVELANRSRAARAAGLDFYDRHREEIIALVLTAAKVAAVIGVRRLAAPKEGASPGRRRLGDAAAVLVAVAAQLGTLVSRQPSALPLLKEMYEKGDPAEQAVVGMILGPALSSDPEHAVEVVREFLEGATSPEAVDTIARRTLGPLLSEHPELVEKVTPWLSMGGAALKRAALLSLERYVADRQSRVGDIVAAGVVVLEDHDEEVRQALRWLLSAAGKVDLDATARAVGRWASRRGPEGRREVQRLARDMPGRVGARIARGNGAAGSE